MRRRALLAALLFVTLPAAANAQNRDPARFRDSLQTVTDVPALFRMERSLEMPGAARSVGPILERGLIAYRIYEITAGIAFNFTGRAGLQLTVYFSTAYQVIGSILAGGCKVDLYVALPLTAGDTLQLLGFTTEGTPPSTVTATGRAPWFAIKRIG